MIPGGNLPRLAECRDCAAPIRFVRMEATGRNMPVNPKPHDENGPGRVAAALRGASLTGYVITLSHPGGNPRYPWRFTAHYSTCGKPPKTSPTPTEPADAPLF